MAIVNGKALKIFEKYLRKSIKDSQKILDIGTSARFVKELRQFEYLFENKKYIAAGYNPSMKYEKYNCDCHQNIENITYHDNEFDTIICLEVLEHVQDPFKASKELYRVLKGG